MGFSRVTNSPGKSHRFSGGVEILTCRPVRVLDFISLAVLGGFGLSQPLL